MLAPPLPQEAQSESPDFPACQGFAVPAAAADSPAQILTCWLAGYSYAPTPAIAVSESVKVVQGNRHFDVHDVDSLGKTNAPSPEAMVSLAKSVLAELH